jgi:hypothetical protein
MSLDIKRIVITSWYYNTYLVEDVAVAVGAAGAAEAGAGAGAAGPGAVAAAGRPWLKYNGRR